MRRFDYPSVGEILYRERLSNGLELVVVPKKDFASAYAFFATRYGGMDTRFKIGDAWRDTPAGIAHYLEHKMFDTEDGNALQELAKNGAEPNAFTANHMTAYHFESSEHFEDNLRILLSFVSIPYFTEESVEKERGIISQEIQMVEDNPDWQVYEQLMACLYRTHPARVPVAGSVESISHITAKTLYDCHKMFYTPSNMILVIVGDVDVERMKVITEEILPKEGGAAAERDYGEKEGSAVATPEAVREMEISLPNFLLGFKCDASGDGEEQVRLSVLGELAVDILVGESSPLFTKLYTTGLINNSFGGGYDSLPGLAMLYVGGESRDPHAVRDAIVQEAQRVVKEGVDEQRFQKLLRGNFGETLRGFNDFETVAIALTEGYFRGYDAFRFPELYKSITAEDVRCFIKNYLTEERMALSMIVPKEEG